MGLVTPGESRIRPGLTLEQTITITPALGGPGRQGPLAPKGPAAPACPPRGMLRNGPGGLARVVGRSAPEPVRY